MAILELIRRASRRELWRMFLLTVIAGVANALLVVMVNRVARLVAVGERPTLTVGWLFIAGFLLYYLCNRRALLWANEMIEARLKRLRIDLMDKLRQTELRTLDKLGRGDLYGVISRETNHLSVTCPLLVDSFQQTVLLLISLMYLFYLSPAAFLVFLLGVSLGVVGYAWINRDFRGLLNLVMRRQGQMLDATADLINGGKELRLNAARSESAAKVHRRLSRGTEGLQVASGDYWVRMIMVNSVVTYLILAVVAFGFPPYSGGYGVIVFELIPVLLFCLGPLATNVARSPMFLQADVGLRSIFELERELDAASSVSPARARELAQPYREFSEIAYDALRYVHHERDGREGFAVGPLSLSVTRGEMVFLVGGNGSGKSTSLRLLTGLYPIDQGVIRVDGAPVVGESVAGFRELFSAVFADFHLFDRLYGLEGVDPDEVQRLIDRMGLADKVRYEEGCFTRTHLSTGQRKRLALIATLLEDRPVLVFDEWAAEQDVHFRKFFYTELLPELKAAGRTVVAVTHDERYWHIADRVIKLDQGRIEWQRAGSELGGE
ncbi:cyclic peptide export ABC transporter [Alkalilimnicola sp. S0819]|uniref:cyclic peptide export ABC transporter n=1 Tax=Alkalilimnicola sp. S0819 TaxID=2613922 RepID=UPI0012621108|nr:cyclic peptide export ABC transporter [Alkalilimnicola sp. S0819]KAB7627755.1 cyclic peptide export ABC transporter [Alkalilimnicola sp. S0819]MPQ15379.1 cyclic peptide export ABC transporter [Alkalilimnicola sp. S0819]